jgi:apolipoprotein N-acyltransferase
MALLLTFVTSVLLILSYPRFGWWPLIFIAYAPLMVAMGGLTKKRRFLLGWFCGTVFILGMQYWVAGTLVAMSGFSWWLAIVCLIAYAAYTGLQWGLFALAYVPVRRWSGRRGWFVTVPLLWVTLEWVFPALFPFTAASALYETPEFLQLGEWTGTAGPSFMVFLVSCTFTHGAEQVSQRRRSDLFVATAVTATWMMVIALGLVRTNQLRNIPIKTTVQVVLIQPNVTVAEKRDKDRRTREMVYERTAELTLAALKLKPDIIIWPEGGFPFYFEVNAPEFDGRRAQSRPVAYSKRLYRLALTLGVDLVAGALRTAEGATRNSVIHLARGDALATIYDKRKLLLFGERVPFADTFPSLKNAIQGMSHHEAGEKSVSFDIHGLRWVPTICYEAIFPKFTRNALRDLEGDVLLNVTNDVWFGNTAAADQHLMLQTQRAIENRVWLIRSTNSGISAFITPGGAVLARTRSDEETVLSAEIPIREVSTTFYQEHGDLLLIIALLMAVLFLIFKQRTPIWNGLNRIRKRRRKSVAESRP